MIPEAQVSKNPCTLPLEGFSYSHSFDRWYAHNLKEPVDDLSGCRGIGHSSARLPTRHDISPPTQVLKYIVQTSLVGTRRRSTFQRGWSDRMPWDLPGTHRVRLSTVDPVSTASRNFHFTAILALKQSA